MEITELKITDEKEWDEYVRKSGCSTFYHQTGWKRVIADTYHHRPLYLVARHEGAICGILPVVTISHPLVGNVSVSLPFAPYGGICADNEETANALTAYLVALSADKNIGPTEIRSLYPVQGGGTLDQSYCSPVLSLRNDTEAQWSGLRKTMRRYVKKAQSANLETVPDSQDMKGFYHLYSRTMRDFGTPAHSEQFFTNIFREFPRNARIAKVNYEGNCIAAILLLEFRGTMIYGWGASDERFSHLHPNYLLFWEAIRDACGRSFTSFDFGRSMVGEGTYLFKTGWGAEPRQLYYHYYPQRGLDTKKNNPNRQMFATLWSKLPVSIASRMGPVLRKYTP
jgi:serine/alanine adding enzyme